MTRSKDEQALEAVFDWLERHWKWTVFVIWLGFAAWFIFSKWAEIRFFALPDTDDNMRMMQVRGLLSGQGWYDLRQHRMNPPWGANIHWSRLVDLPIAGLILVLKPFLGISLAERSAVAIAPLLPYLLAFYSLALAARRLVDRRAFWLVFIAIFFAGSANGMFMPERIDHHGWQLAFLALMVASIADPRRTRGGVTLAVATALSLAIGLEMLIYIALAGAAMVLFWVADRDEAERLRAYAVTLSAGTSAAFLVFASNDNWNAVCDALSPVWLSDVLLGGALMFGLTLVSPADWKRRLALAAVAGLILAAFHALTWPHCIQRLEGVSPEVEQLWLSHVREARPVYRHGWRLASLIVALPITGAIGWALLAWLRRGDPERFRRTLAAAAPALAAGILLLWQTRTGPAAQLLGTIGAAGLIWTVVPWTWNSSSAVIRVLGTSAAALIGGGALIPLAFGAVPDNPPTARQQAISKANRLCASLWGLRPIAQQPRGMVFTFIDLGPRLITVTHHDAVGGPYHRNGQQIADVMNAFRGDADQAHRIIAKYRSNYLLTCPSSSTTTIFESEAPKGFYVQLQRGKVPAWLTPVPLPKDSPFRMWRVTG